MTITGEITAVGQSYVPVQAFVFIHLIQVTIDGRESFNAVAEQPEGKVATEDGSQAAVTGAGKLHLINEKGASFLNLDMKGLLHSEVHAARE